MDRRTLGVHRLGVLSRREGMNKRDAQRPVRPQNPVCFVNGCATLIHVVQRHACDDHISRTVGKRKPSGVALHDRQERFVAPGSASECRRALHADHPMAEPQKLAPRVLSPHPISIILLGWTGRMVRSSGQVPSQNPS